MEFKELKKEDGYKYETETWHGEFEWECKEKLSKRILDDVFMAIIQSGETDGWFKHKDLDEDTKITFNWEQSNQWLDADDDEEETIVMGEDESEEIEEELTIWEKIKSFFNVK